MFHTSRIEISKSALEHNLRFIRNRIGADVIYSSVVKGNAYGHGIDLFVPLAEACGVNHLAVFSANEALRVKKVSNGQSTIMIMGMIDNAEIDWAIENDIEFFVFEMDRLESTIRAAKRMGKKANIHLEIETGMNRTGLDKDWIPAAADLLQKNADHIVFKGLCTHFAGAESIANYYRIQKQKRRYRTILERLEREGIQPHLRHTACSAATMRYPKTQLDMVRIGILQYGFFPSREVLVDYLSKTNDKNYPLERLISWKSKVMDIKEVKTGEFIGYGTSYLANVDTRIAIVPVGYANGFARRLSNQGRVLIHGQRVNVVGMVNMNMILVNISDLQNVKKGDEVVIIGNQGDLEMSVTAFGEFSVQVNYELLTRLPVDIPRHIVD